MSDRDARSPEEVDALLPAEPSSSEIPDDAAHWAAVYEELSSFLQGNPGTDPHPAVLERYTRRRDFWQRRVDELTSAPETAPD